MKKINSSFVLPKYQNDCFSNIPSTILNLFGIDTKQPTVSKKYIKRYLNKNYRNIILLLIDALGLYQWKKHANQFPLFSQLNERGCFGPITSIFPSTTASALNTIASGLTPAKHGLFEWVLYIKEIDKTINTLPFKELSSGKRDSLLDENINPKILYNFPTIYQKLKRHNINSFSFKNKSYANSIYTKISSEGSNNISFVNSSDLIVKLKNLLNKSKGKNYFFIYWDKLDTLSHDYSPDDEACKVELSKIAYLFLNEFIKKLNKNIKRETLLIITADHGQIAVNPSKTIYLNKDQVLMNSLKKDQKGNVILPTGGPRDVLLYIKETDLENIYKYLLDKLKNKADVIKTDEAIALGLFGKKQIEDKFKNRLGNLIILPYKNYTIWREYKKKKFTYFGHHGGLSKEEMLIPFVICSLDEIKSE